MINRTIRFIQNYLFFGLPLVVLCLAIQTLPPSYLFDKMYMILPSFVWHLIGFCLMAWFILLFLFLITLVTVPSIRERVLRRLANLNERDEREQYITGQASRAAYISTLSLMLFFLFTSMFSISIYQAPKELPNAPKYTLSMGFAYSLLKKDEIENSPKGNVIFDSKNISLSNATIIFILLGWQLLVFNLTARKAQKIDI